MSAYYNQNPVDWIGRRMLPCGCCCEASPKHLTVIMTRADLITAMNEKANLIARTAPQITDEQRLLLKDMAEDGQNGIVADAIEDAWASLVHAVSGYAECLMEEDIEVESKFVNTHTYKVVLDAARNFSALSVNAVGRGCRSFIIHSALAYYLNLVGMPDQAATFSATAENDLADTKRYLAASARPQRLPYFPPW